MTRTRSRGKRRIGLFMALALTLAMAILLGMAGSATANLNYTRTNDAAPYFGGDLLELSTSSGTTDCTSGFMGFDHGGNQYTTTAAHCGASSGWQINTRPFANTVLTSPTHDTQLMMEYTSTHNWGYIFVGSGGFHRVVYNWETTAQDAPGLTDCFSGAVGVNEICGYVEKVNQPWLGHSGAHAVWVHCPISSQDCVRDGDSGSPVYAIYNSGPYTNDVEATGLLVGTEVFLTNGVPSRYDFVFVPIRDIVAWAHAYWDSTYNLDCLLCS